MEMADPHKLTVEAELEHVLKTDLVTVYFYTDIVIVEAKEGVTLSYKTAFSILVMGLKYVGSRPFVYIANRVNSYSVNPNDYVYLEKVPTLKGIAIVTPTELGKKNAELELNFFRKPMEIFDNVSEAYLWGKQLLHS
ncbi:hypothetical protein C5O00_11555 [Pukyongia salina]|uniref:Uncharacterized protein n=1 Tax=Pukyongia salina TaxID=2094025 RepID=A0A2S0HYK0_9FLAO|nr:hypothetical protein [Pukyongia salina]AVI51767.1 hypothetical protein C5O00_11555 [Pukyongia salina]